MGQRKVLVELTPAQIEVLIDATSEYEDAREHVEGMESQPDRRTVPTVQRARRALIDAVRPGRLPRVPPPELNRTVSR